MNYIVSPLAETDMEDIWQYIAQDNETAANRMIHKISETFDRIVKTPYMGRSREELRPNIRSFGATPYVILYRPLPDTIEIVRVLHSARDIDGVFH